MRLRSSAERGDLLGAHGKAFAPAVFDTEAFTVQQLEEISKRREATGESVSEAASALALKPNEAAKPRLTLDLDDERVNALVVAAFDLDDPLAQSVRSLRGTITALRLGNGQPIRTLAMLSVGAPTEASVIAANLATVFAQADYATLLVDANLQRPQQHALFGTPTVAGVVELLQGADIESQLLEPTPIRKLWLLGTGSSVQNAPELFERHCLARKLVRFDDDVEIIIVDASQSTEDSPIIVDQIDAAVLVVRQHISKSVQFIKY